MLKETCPKCKNTSSEVTIVPNHDGTKRRCIWCGHRWDVIKKRSKPKMKTTVKLVTEVDIQNVFTQYLKDDKTKAIDLVRFLGAAAWKESMHKVVFPLSLLANEEDVDNVQLSVIVCYIVNNWDSICKISEKWFKETKEKKAKENEGEVCGTCAEWGTCRSTEGWRRNSSCSGLNGVKWKAPKTKRNKMKRKTKKGDSNAS